MEENSCGTVALYGPFFFFFFFADHSQELVGAGINCRALLSGFLHQ